jgi:hypothetical protein
MVPAYLALSESYRRSGHPELSTQVLREGLKANPSSVEIQSRLTEGARK